MGQHIIVGTPGRVFDMIGKRHLRVDDLVTFVLDEADEMLSRGFELSVYDIFKTMPPISRCARPDIKFRRDAVILLFKKDELTLEGFRQIYVAIEQEESNYTHFPTSMRHRARRRCRSQHRHEQVREADLHGHHRLD